MDNIIRKVAIAVIGAVVGGLIGEINGMMIALLVFMAIGYITGVIIAIEGKVLSSEIGFKGLLRKVMILFVIIVANVVDVYVIGDTGEEEMTQAQFNETYNAINPQYTAISQELKDLGVLKGDGTNEINIRLEGLQGAVIALRAVKAVKE